MSEFELADLEKAIEELRSKLHGVSMGRLLTDPQVIKASEDLDILLVKYLKMLNSRNK